MRFPEYTRVIYDRNPLEQVIAQLRFPAILKIDSALPADFQERIRSRYPDFLERPPADDAINIPQELKANLPQEFLKAMGLDIQPASAKQGYEFISEDKAWKVVLTRDFLALSTQRYTTWEDFSDRLNAPRQALTDCYGPVYYSRIGLRYRDVIRRSVLDLNGVAWTQRLKPHVAGMLASEVASHVKHTASVALIDLEDGRGQVRIRHTLALLKNPDEECYVIDADFFTDRKTEVGDAIQRLDYFNREAGRLFKWCINDRLHSAMGPRIPGV